MNTSLNIKLIITGLLIVIVLIVINYKYHTEPTPKNRECTWSKESINIKPEVSINLIPGNKDTTKCVFDNKLTNNQENAEQNAGENNPTNEDEPFFTIPDMGNYVLGINVLTKYLNKH